MPSRRARILILATCLVIVGVIVCWLSASAIKVGLDLRQVQSVSRNLGESLRESDWQQLEVDAESLRTATSSLRRATSSSAWGLIENLPLIGRSASSVNQMSVALEDLAMDMLPVVDGLSSTEPLVRKIAVVIGDQQSLTNVAEALQSLDVAVHDLAGETILRPVVLGIRAVSVSIGQARGVLESTRAASPYVPAMLGFPNSRTWLAILGVSNVQEPGSFWPIASATITANQGLIRIQPGSPEIDTHLASLRDKSPISEKAVLDSVTERFDSDGVVLLDQEALRVLLESGGPVRVGGNTVSADRAADWLGDGVANSQAAAQLLTELWVRTTASFRALVGARALFPGADEPSHVIFQVKDPAEQRWLEEIGLASSRRN